MSLSAYHKKRSFGHTPEPSGKKSSSKGSLHFVVQKHHASHLHYDFRLEMDGVLKSWAVPKGPSMNPSDKRLAMMVEDHPYAYKDFEGNIPEGNYGAGSVIVWDEGIYEPAESRPGAKKEVQKNLLQQIKKGSLKINLHGEKLKGGFALVHTHYRGENAWLLIKEKDRFAKTSDITKKNKSVKSGLKIEQVAKQSTREWTSNKKSKPGKTQTPLPRSKKKSGKEITGQAKPGVSPATEKIIKKGAKSSIPSGIIPMKATLTDKPFDSKDWLYEIKWDGYRALAYIHKGKTELRSRKDISFTKKYYPVANALDDWKINAVIDGEIVAVNPEGKADFQLLQQWQKTEQGELVYYVFDILWLKGYSLEKLPLRERKEILRDIVPANSIIRYSDHIEEKGKAFFEAATSRGLEGIMAKLAESVYTPGIRSRQWLKIKTHLRQEVVIAGFTETRKSRQYFGALILGVYKGKELHYVGHTGSGFNDNTMATLHKKLKTLVTAKSSFGKNPGTNMPATWVKPKLVCEIEFAEWTADGIMRMPIFKGLWDDKNPGEVHREESIPANPRKIKSMITSGQP